MDKAVRSESEDMKLFIAMPYGKRKAPLDYEKPDETYVIDFDLVWTQILKPAVPKGFDPKRADELRGPGLIDRKYIELLFEADIVLADLTFGNPNVYYELGIRQALSKKGTVMVACNGTKLPFDVRNQTVIHYDYFASPAPRAASALREFQKQLRQAIEEASGPELNSPVHVLLPGLSIGLYKAGKSPEARVQELTQRTHELETTLMNQQSQDGEERLLDKLRMASTAQQVLRLYQLSFHMDIKSVRLLELLAVRLRDSSYFDESLLTLDRALKMDPNDPELLREMGFVYRKKGPEFYSQAEEYMERALRINDFDSELHGMLGGLFKRRCEYEQALIQYKRAHELQPGDLYPLVTVGAMCGALGRIEEAKKWYRMLQTTCEKNISQRHADHWTYLCLGEAAVVLGSQKEANNAYQTAIDTNPPLEHIRSEVEQLEFLVKMNFAAENAKSVLPILQNYLMIHQSQF
jgi:tetratricopeptide (TPR) repeat protein